MKDKMYARYSIHRSCWCVCEPKGGLLDRMIESGLSNEKEANLMIELIREERGRINNEKS